MLGTIANALAAHVGRTPGRVGFALDRKLLPWCAIFYFPQDRRFHRQRGIWREMTGVEPGVGFTPERMQRLRLAEMILFPL
jgi:hypothetical protein